MKRILLILLAVAVAGNFAFAQAPKTKQGDKAFLFTINGFGDFGVGSSPVGTVFVGSTGTPVSLAGFGLKYYVANDVAIRGALAATFASSTQKITGETDDEASATAFGIIPGLQYHISTMGSVTAYVGAFVVVGAVSASVTPSVPIPGPSVETKFTGLLFGVGGIIGAEFYPWENVSLGAEYQLGFTNTSGETEAPGATVEGPTTTEIGISSFAVTLGVNW